MKASLTIAPNVVALRCDGPRYRGLDVALRECYARHRSHNLITTEGLAAWAYNLINSDGQTIDRLLLGDDATAPALGDTALGNLLYTISNFETYLCSDTAIFIHWLDFALDSLSAGEIKEYGLKTTNSGATTSSNKLINHGVFDETIPVSDEGYIVIVANLTVKGATAPDGNTNQTWTDFGLNWAASRIYDLALYDILDRVGFGTGTAVINPRESAELSTEVHRTQPTWARNAGSVSTAGTIASGGANADLQELGPGTGSAKGTGVNYLVNNSGGYAAGTTVIAADTGTGTILVDNYVSFIGVRRHYRVTSALSGGSMTVTPGLADAVDDNAAITVHEPVLLQDRGTTAKGTASGYLINNGGGYAAATKTVTVDTGTGTILVGNGVRFEGDDDLYIVTRALASNAFTFTPGLVTAIDDDAEVTVVNHFEADNTTRDVDYYVRIDLANV